MSGIEIRAESVTGLTIKFDGFDMSVFSAVLAAAMSGKQQVVTTAATVAAPDLEEKALAKEEPEPAEQPMAIEGVVDMFDPILHKDAVDATLDKLSDLAEEAIIKQKLAEKMGGSKSKPETKAEDPKLTVIDGKSKAKPKKKGRTVEEMAASASDALDVIAEIEATGRPILELIAEDQKEKADRIARGLPPICPEGCEDPEPVIPEAKKTALPPASDPRKYELAADWDDDNPVKGHISDFYKNDPQTTWKTDAKEEDPQSTWDTPLVDDGGWDTPLEVIEPELDGSDNPKYADPKPSDAFDFDSLGAWDLPPVI